MRNREEILEKIRELEVVKTSLTQLYDLMNDEIYEERLVKEITREALLGTQHEINLLLWVLEEGES